MFKNILSVSVAMLFMTSISYGGKSVVIDLSTQTATAYENDIPTFSGNISSGTAKRATPTGHFKVLEKDIDHVSNSWPKPNGGAKMHYMLRLTRYGIAMHLGYVPNYPASHGCIRLQNGFAQKMYRWAHVGMPVHIVGHAPRRVYRTSKAKAKNVKYTKKVRKVSPKISVSPNRETIQRRRVSKINRYRKRKASTLDVLNTSPKAKKRVIEAENERWKNRPKKKASHQDPLKALRG